MTWYKINRFFKPLTRLEVARQLRKCTDSLLKMTFYTHLQWFTRQRHVSFETDKVDWRTQSLCSRVNSWAVHLNKGWPGCLKGTVSSLVNRLRMWRDWDETKWFVYVPFLVVARKLKVTIQRESVFTDYHCMSRLWSSGLLFCSKRGITVSAVYILTRTTFTIPSKRPSDPPKRLRLKRNAIPKAAQLAPEVCIQLFGYFYESLDYSTI